VVHSGLDIGFCDLEFIQDIHLPLQDMNSTDFNDTICAIATGAGNGAIAVIRIAGANAISIGDKIFSARKQPLPEGQENAWKGNKGHQRLPEGNENIGEKIQENNPLAKAIGNSIRFGVIRDGDMIIDEVLVSIFKAPYSYTGEDVIEISCHGSPFIQQSILQLIIMKGARLAKPGEFTQRAFLNGKMDLAQAEAVADLVKSSSLESHRIAMDQMRGGFSDEISKLRLQLLQFISLIELELDFSEEDVEFADRTHLRSLLSEIYIKLSRLIKSFQAGNAIKDGIPVVIAGLPNAGKSTLLNVFLNEERAIVSELPGTTRDVIEDEVHIEGFLFRFIDTAGLRQTEDKIEMIGIRKAYEKLKQARIVLLICDINQEVEEIAAQIDALGEEIRQKVIIVLNKSDLHESESAQEKSAILSNQFGLISVPISAREGYQIEKLREELVRTMKNDFSSDSNVLVSNMRHFEALSRAAEASVRASKGLSEKLPTDLIAQDIREILHYLGEITGEITNDEILGNIFANFCIGK
jgi:tRNA modification GTPase